MFTLFKAKDRELRIRDKVMRFVRDQLRESKRTVEDEKLARKKLEERYDEKFQELENQLRENENLVDLVRKLKEQLKLERSYREQDRRNFQRQLQQDRGEFQRQLLQDRGEFQRQLQQDRGEFQRQFRELQQQQTTNLQHQYRQHLQHVERVAEENCARHQQPETRTWIIQRNEVVLSDKVLGEGSWGIVRQGTFRGSPVAIKELYGVNLSPHNRRLFEREMEILSRCRHFNIVQFMGATSDDQPPLLVTELLHGNLRELLKDRKMIREIPVVSLALDVARGLNFMHRSQPPIIHRDVKSDNVLLKRWDQSWVAKVSDFGTANFRRRIMTPNQGTPLYSAPESSTAQHSELVSVCVFRLQT